MSKHTPGPWSIHHEFNVFDETRIRKMDSKANTLEQVEIARRILWGLAQDLPPASSDWNQLVELVLALDEWRKHGGFDPYTEHGRM